MLRAALRPRNPPIHDHSTTLTRPVRMSRSFNCRSTLMSDSGKSTARFSLEGSPPRKLSLSASALNNPSDLLGACSAPSYANTKARFRSTGLALIGALKWHGTICLKSQSSHMLSTHSRTAPRHCKVCGGDCAVSEAIWIERLLLQTSRPGKLRYRIAARN